MLERLALRFLILRPACRVPERKIAEGKARHADELDDILRAGHHDCRDAGRFERARRKTDTLVADRAVRREDGNVRLVLQHALHDFRAVDIERCAMAAVRRKAVHMRREPADQTAGSRVAQRRQRKPGAGIFLRRVIAIDADMRDTRVVIFRRIERIDDIEFRCRIVRRARPLVALVGLIERRRGDQRHLGLTERLFQRREGHVVVVRPLVGRAIAKAHVVVTNALAIPDGLGMVGREAEILVGRDAHGAVSSVLVL